jgi:hypothetical protein
LRREIAVSRRFPLARIVLHRKTLSNPSRGANASNPPNEPNPGGVEMRSVLSLAIAAVFTLAFSAEAQAQTVTFTAALHGGNENPGVTTGSAGTATVTWNTATKAGTYRVDVFNMPVGTTASHIHVGAPGVNGPVVINFTVPVGGISNDYGLTGTFACSDVVNRAAQGINSCEDFEQALLLNNTYVNVHSTANPGGEIRGQLTRQ